MGCECVCCEDGFGAGAISIPTIYEHRREGLAVLDGWCAAKLRCGTHDVVQEIPNVMLEQCDADLKSPKERDNLNEADIEGKSETRDEANEWMYE